MTREDILEYLRSHRTDLREGFGVQHIGLFGSYARNDAREDSDVDLVVELEAGRKTLRNYFSLKRHLEAGLGRPVDLGMEGALKPLVREAVRKDVLYV